MPRTPRKKSAVNIYHIMIRGNNKQQIFLDHDDYDRFLSILAEKRQNRSLVLYAWCLMPNHIHLLIKEKQEQMDQVFRSMLTGFVLWYNTKYKRVGHLFQGRFKSQPVDDETYFLRVVRYIHRNPLEAKLCGRMEDYPYSSFSYYFRSGKYQDKDLVFNLIRKDEFERYHMKADENDENFLDIDQRDRLNDEEFQSLALGSGIVGNISEVKSLPRDQRDQMIQLLLRSGASYRQINRLTGLSLNIIRAVSRALRGII